MVDQLYLSAAGFSADWGAVKLADALYTISNDISRIQKLLPELSPQDRCFLGQHRPYFGDWSSSSCSYALLSIEAYPDVRKVFVSKGSILASSGVDIAPQVTWSYVSPYFKPKNQLQFPDVKQGDGGGRGDGAAPHWGLLFGARAASHRRRRRSRQPAGAQPSQRWWVF